MEHAYSYRIHCTHLFYSSFPALSFYTLTLGCHHADLRDCSLLNGAYFDHIPCYQPSATWVLHASNTPTTARAGILTGGYNPFIWILVVSYLQNLAKERQQIKSINSRTWSMNSKSRYYDWRRLSDHHNPGRILPPERMLYHQHTVNSKSRY